MTVTLYDSIEVSEIPANAQAVAGYTGGKWPTFKELLKRFPKAHKLSIAVRWEDDAECLDIEEGDASPSEAPAWYHRQKARGISRPCFYTSLSGIDKLVAVLKTAGIERSDYRLWSAHYSYRAHICGPSEGIGSYADATQYSDRALGRNLDVSLCEDSFFGSPSPPYVVPADEARWEKEWDALEGKKGPWPHLRRLVLIRYMLHRQRAIVAAAEESGWSVEARHKRYELLFERTQKR